MTQFHRTAQPNIRWFLAVLIGTIIVQSCNPHVAAPTPIPTVEPNITATAAPSATPIPTPSLSQTPTQTPTATSEPTPDLFAGFTQNPDIPFILFHQSGESLAALEGVNPSTLRGVIWTSSDGASSIVVYADSDGMPESAVVGDDVLFYSNFTKETVDLTIVHPDGSQETVQATRNTDVLDKLEALAIPYFKLVSFPIVDTQSPAPEDALDALEFTAKLLGAAACLYAIAQTGGFTLSILGGACLGTILTVITTVGNALGLHVEIIEEFGFQASMFKCPFVLTGKVDFLKDCFSAAVTALRKIRDSAAEANRERAGWIQHEYFIPPGVQNPIPSLDGTVLERSFCRYAPSAFHLPKTGFKPQAPVEVVGRDADGDWLHIQLRGRNEPCWINAKLVQPDGNVMSLPDEYPLNTRLPFSDDFEQITITSVSPGASGVTVEWLPHIIRSDLVEEGAVEYIVEVWTCVDGKPAFYAIGTNDTFATIQIDNSCGVASHADVIGQDQHGFSPPAVISLP